MTNVSPPGEPMERLIQAIRTGRASEVQLLVQSTPALAGGRDLSGVSVLVLALYHGHRDIAEWLASCRTDLDVFEAASLGDAPRVQELVSAEPSLAEAVSPDGFTALALASFFGHLSVVRLLVARGADLNAVSRNGARYTPLTGAVAGGHAEVVRELLRSGANAAYRYGPGYTPLHEAAANGSAEIVRALLSAGADPEARSDEGRTPLDYAREKGHEEVASLLAARADALGRAS